MQVALDCSGRPHLELDLQCAPNTLAFARALPMATEVDPGRSGQVPNSKGVLERAGVVEGCVGLG